MQFLRKANPLKYKEKTIYKDHGDILHTVTS